MSFTKEYEPKGEIKVDDLELSEFQYHAIRIAVKSKYSIVSAAVRAGKTAIIAGCLRYIGHYPACVVTQGKDLVKQATLDIRGHLIKDDIKIGFFSEGKWEVGDIVVTSYEALAHSLGTKSKNSKKLSTAIKKRNEEVLEWVARTKVLIADECHCGLSVKRRAALRYFTNVGYRIGLSGTPRPDSKSQIELESVFGPIRTNITFDKLIKQGRVAQPVVVVYDMPVEWYEAGWPRYADVETNNLVENYRRNLFIARVVQELNKKGKSSLILVRRRYHGELLQELIPESVYICGDDSSSFRRCLYDRIQEGSLNCIITTVAKLGLNIPKLSAVINAEGYKAKNVTIQKMRSLTASSEKEYGLVIDFLDKGKYLRNHSSKRYQLYQQLPGFIVKKRRVPRHFELEMIAHAQNR